MPIHWKGRAKQEVLPAASMEGFTAARQCIGIPSLFQRIAAFHSHSLYIKSVCLFPLPEVTSIDRDIIGRARLAPGHFVA